MYFQHILSVSVPVRSVLQQIQHSQRNKTVNRCNPQCYQNELKLKIVLCQILQCIRVKLRAHIVIVLNAFQIYMNKRRGCFERGLKSGFHTREVIDTALPQHQHCLDSRDLLNRKEFQVSFELLVGFSQKYENTLCIILSSHVCIKCLRGIKIQRVRRSILYLESGL